MIRFRQRVYGLSAENNVFAASAFKEIHVVKAGVIPSASLCFFRR